MDGGLPSDPRTCFNESQARVGSGHSLTGRRVLFPWAVLEDGVCMRSSHPVIEEEKL